MSEPPSEDSKAPAVRPIADRGLSDLSELSDLGITDEMIRSALKDYYKVKSDTPTKNKS